MAAPETQPYEGPETLITPPGAWQALNLRELWEYREMIYFLTKRELQIRYKQSFFGVSWAVLQPLTFAFIFGLFFGTVFKQDTEIPYVPFVIAGLVPWLFTSQAITASATSLVRDSDLISKVYFPRLALPLAQSLNLLIDMVLAFGVVLVVAVLYGVGIQWTIVFVPLFVLLGILATFGLGTLLAAVNVKYRDVQLVMPMLVQVLFFVSPVFFAARQLVKGDWIYLYAINPLVTVLEGTRWALYGTEFPGWGVIGISVGACVILFSAALIYFQRTQQYFADLI
jgi:homopolymeric O-antigen transport system permease protein